MKRRLHLSVDLLLASITAAMMLGILAIVLIMFFRIASWQSLANQIPDAKDRITIHNELLKTLVQLLGGALLLGGFYFTWRTIRVSQEGQITDRFNKAVDHLGSSSLEIRLGGIYALCRIATDSQRDSQAVMDILCAYVRCRTRNEQFRSPPADIQAIVKWISSQPKRRLMIDLSGAVLTGADLRHGSLDFVILENTNMEDVDLSGSSLVSADLSTAVLNNATLKFASLRKANLRAASFQDAGLRGADLRDTDILGSNFKGSNLSGANLGGAQNAVRQQFEDAIIGDDTTLPVFEVPIFR